MAEEWIEVGVVIDKKPASSPWVDHLYMPSAVLLGVPTAAPWTILERGVGFERCYLGACALVLASSDTANYRVNLAAERPKLWVVLSTDKVDPPVGLMTVTADPAEGEAHSASDGVIVETVDMPEELIAILDAFIARHHVERPFIKRQRKRFDTGESSA